METLINPTTPDEEVQEGKSNGIKVEKISEIKDHVGEVFVSENINVSEEKVKAFIDTLGDINPIHFDLNRINESAFAKKSEGRIFVPGLLTQTLWCNKDVIYQALQIQQSYEVTLKSTGSTKFVAPVFAGSDLVFELKLKSAEDCKVESRDSVKTIWDIIAYTMIDGKMRVAMATDATLLYTSLT